MAFNRDDQSRNSHSFQAAARLRPGVTLTAAKAELDTLGRALAKQYPDDNEGETATLSPMKRARRRAVEADAHRAQRRGRAGAADRLRQRRQPAARAGVIPPPGVRRAVGPRRLTPQAGRARCSARASSLPSVGGAAGIGVAWAGTSAIAGVLPRSIVFAPFRDAAAGIKLDPWVLGFTALAVGDDRPALQPRADRRPPPAGPQGRRRSQHDRTSRRTCEPLSSPSKSPSRSSSSSRPASMIKSLVRLVSIDSGLESANVLVLEMALPQPDFYGPPVRETFCSDVAERVGTHPGRAVGRGDQPSAAERGQRRPRPHDRGQDDAARGERVRIVPPDLSRLFQVDGHPDGPRTRLRRPRRDRSAGRRHHQRGDGEAVLAERGSGRPADEDRSGRARTIRG